MADETAWDSFMHLPPASSHSNVYSSKGIHAHYFDWTLVSSIFIYCLQKVSLAWLLLSIHEEVCIALLKLKKKHFTFLSYVNHEIWKEFHRLASEFCTCNTLCSCLCLLSTNPQCHKIMLQAKIRPLVPARERAQCLQSNHEDQSSDTRPVQQAGRPLLQLSSHGKGFAEKTWASGSGKDPA